MSFPKSELKRSLQKAGFRRLWKYVKRDGREGIAIRTGHPKSYWLDPKDVGVFVLFDYCAGRLPESDIQSIDETGDQITITLTDAAMQRRINQYPDGKEVLRGQISAFGGLPSLPTNFDWPRTESDYFDFVGQISLSELPGCEARRSLPAKGVLSFFLGWTGEVPEPIIRCFHFQEVANLREADRHPRMHGWAGRNDCLREEDVDPETLAPKPVELSFRPQFFFPYCDMEDLPDEFEGETLVSRLESMDNEDEFNDVVGKVYGSHRQQECWLHHQLLGTPYFGQQIMVPSEYLQERLRIPRSERRILLMQMGPWGPYQWGDMGHIYIFIQPDDLAAGRFDRLDAYWDFF